MNKESMQKMERLALESLIIMALVVSGTVAYSAEPERILVAENKQTAKQSETALGGGRKEHGAQTKVDLAPYMGDLERRIKRSWFPPHGQEMRRVPVIFKIHSPDLRLERTSGVELADQAALAAVLKAAPFRPLPAGSPAVLEIRFAFDYDLFTKAGHQVIEYKNAPPGRSDIGSSSASGSGAPSALGRVASSSGGSWSSGPIVITASSPAKLSGASLTEVDFGPYMADLQRRIKRAWFPPRGQESRRIIVIFKIHSDGQLSSLRLLTASGVALADQAALAAVQNAAPFRPLPANAPAVIAVQFTFDSNVFTGGRSF